MSVFAELTPPYSTIVADPPWHYDERVTGWEGGRSTVGSMPYSTMSVEDIAALPVVDLAAPGAHLYLWTTNQHLWAARDVVLGWGFEPTQILTWCKPARWRPGGLFSPSTEFVVFARRTVGARRVVARAGHLIRDARVAAGLNPRELHRLVRGGTPTGLVARWEGNDSLPNERDWERLREVLPGLAEVERPYVPPAPKREPSRVYTSWWCWDDSGGHSSKPAAFLDLVEQVSPGPYVELFCRTPRLGWDSWGNGYEIGATA